MIKFSLKGITAEQLEFKVNKINQPATKIEVKPTFSRQLRTANENNKIYLVALDCKITSTEQEPKPFDLVARYVGIFETDGIETEADRKQFAIKATAILFPYLRQAVTSLTQTAMINPLILPVIPGDILFPEDRLQESKDQYVMTYNGEILS